MRRRIHARHNGTMSDMELALVFVGSLALVLVAIAAVTCFGLFLVWVVKMVAHLTGVQL